MRYDGFIFDVDGVLIDVKQSFAKAALDAVKANSGSDRFGMAEFAILKTIPGFNNDWFVAIAGAAWTEMFPDERFEVFAKRIATMGGGLAGLRMLVGTNLDSEFEERITRLAMESYGGTSACEQLYGFLPTTIVVPGAWQNENGLVTEHMIAPIIDKCGILTGRNSVEMALGWDILGWSLPCERIATSDNENWHKPKPAGLAHVIDSLVCTRPLFIGDSRDDYQTVVNARNEGIDCDFCHVSSVEQTWGGIDFRVKSVTELFEQLEATA